MFASSSQWIIAAILRRSLSTLKLSCALHIVPACRKQKLFGWSWTRSETFHRGPAFCRELWQLWFHGFLPTNVLKRIARMDPSTLPHQGRQLLVPLLGLAQKSKISSADFKPASCLQHGRHDAKFGQIWSLEAVHERDLFCLSAAICYNFLSLQVALWLWVLQKTTQNRINWSDPFCVRCGVAKSCNWRW